MCSVGVVGANRLESQEDGWPATRVEGNTGKSTFGSRRRLFVIGWGGPFWGEVNGWGGPFW